MHHGIKGGSRGRRTDPFEPNRLPALDVDSALGHLSQEVVLATAAAQSVPNVAIPPARETVDEPSANRRQAVHAWPESYDSTVPDTCVSIQPPTSRAASSSTPGSGGGALLTN